MSDIDDRTEINIDPDDVIVDEDDLVSISVSVLPPEVAPNPLEALARQRFIDLNREPPHWLQVIEREGRIGRFFARRISNYMTWKSGRPYWELLKTYTFEVVSIGLALAASVGFNVWLWTRP